MTIHTIGDSHSCNGWPATVKDHHIGPVLCYSFGRDNLGKCDIRNFDIKDGDTIVFCFGEIDCRCHIHKHISEMPYQQIIDITVAQYARAIDINLRVSSLRPRYVCVYNVVPPIQRHKKENHTVYPFLGEDEERKQYVLYFNKKLREMCASRGYIFFDVYDKYTDENGFLSDNLCDGNCHIGNGVHIDAFIRDHGLDLVPVAVLAADGP